MKPRTYKINKHRSFLYYTPEDVAEILERLAKAEAELARLATLRERGVLVAIKEGAKS